MADQKISAMPAAATPLTGAELIPLVQSGANVRSTVALFGQYARSAFSNFGGWADTTTQLGSTTGGVEFTYNQGDYTENGVSLVDNSKLTVAVGGVYNLQWSAQFANLDVAPQDAYVWIKINGVDVIGSAGIIGLSARKNPNIPFHGVFGWNFFITLQAGQYVQLYWYKTSANISVPAFPATVTPAIPSTASVVVTLAQVA